MAPTIIFVPGFWEGPEPFEGVSRLLADTGLQTMTCTLPSTGTTSPGNPGMHDDIAAIRSSIETVVVTHETDVVMVLHSGGGFLGSNALEGLSAKARREQGLKGGVLGIVFLTAAMYPEGFIHGDLPFAEIKGGALLCSDPRKTLFNDLEPAVTDKWLGKLKTQPASGWNDVVTFCGWREVPSVYLVCEKDQALPRDLQIQIAETAGSRIERCDAGHMVILSMPKKVAEVIQAAVASF